MSKPGTSKSTYYRKLRALRQQLVAAEHMLENCLLEYRAGSMAYQNAVRSIPRLRQQIAELEERRG